MKDNFGKRTTGNSNSSNKREVVSIFLLVVLVLVLIYLARDAYNSGIGPQAPLLVVSGMLGNPFKSTRKMKVPYHSRIGHRERSFVSFAKTMFTLCIVLLLLLFIFQTVSRF